MSYTKVTESKCSYTFPTCGGMSSRSQWVCLAGVSSALGSDTVLPRSCRCHAPTPALSSGSWRWKGQGSLVSSTKRTGNMWHNVSWTYVSLALAFVSNSVTVNTHTNDLAKQKSAARFTNIQASAWVQCQACLPSVLWEQLLTLLCDVVAWIKTPKSWHDRSCWTTHPQAPPWTGFNGHCVENSSEVHLSHRETRRDDMCEGEAWTRRRRGGGGSDLTSWQEYNDVSPVCHYIINVMGTTFHICISQIRYMIKTMSILIFTKKKKDTEISIR